MMGEKDKETKPGFSHAQAGQEGGVAAGSEKTTASQPEHQGPAGNTRGEKSWEETQ